MLANFKKLGAAAAVAAAIGASGAAQAVILGQPGDALFIPHVIYDSKAGVNTLIGVVVGGNTAGAQNTTPIRQLAGTNFSGDNGRWAAYVPGDDGPGCVATRPDDPAASRPLLHWYFFNSKSEKVLDGRIPVTCEDFVRFDWGFLAGKGQDGVPGYLVIADNVSSGPGHPGSRLALYGQSYLIKGIFQSMAFIPVLPVSDIADVLGATDPVTGIRTIGNLDDVYYSGDNFPTIINPVSAGMGLADRGPANAFTYTTAQFSLRYFLDPALEAGTAFVIWLPSNGANRDVGVDVYDADEVFVSQRVKLPNQLNVLLASDIGGTVNNSAEPGPGWPTGHEIPDYTNPPGLDPVNSGFALFRLSDGATRLGPGSNFVRADGARAGVAFSLINIGSIDNQAQVQTELAHERGLF